MRLQSWRKGEIRRVWRNYSIGLAAFVIAALIVVVLVLTTPLWGSFRPLAGSADSLGSPGGRLRISHRYTYRE